MNKRALTTNFLIIIILAFTIMFILIVFQSGLFTSMQSGSIKQTCKQSVTMHDFTKFGKLALATKLICPTQELKIKVKKEEQINYKLAKSMHDCWDQFNQGRANLFGNEETIYCSICHIISFKQKDKEVKGFSKYLTTKKVPGEGGITYMDYLLNYETVAAEEIVDTLIEEDILDQKIIDTSKEYATIFLYSKGEHPTNPWTAVGVGAGVVVVTIVTWGSSTVVLGAAAVGGSVAAGTTYTAMDWLNPNKFEWSSSLILREYNDEELKNIGCKVMPISQK